MSASPHQFKAVLPSPRACGSDIARLGEKGLPFVLFSLRLWASVCLALFITFSLELDSPYWAATTAALLCQPRLGASLRKGWFRMLGTLVGAFAIVCLTAMFPQDRFAFLLSLALWCSLCAFLASLLKNFASYAAALAGFTAAIIATDQLGAVGGLNGNAFLLAIDRSSEIIIGIVCAGTVLAATDFGGARLRLFDHMTGLFVDGYDALFSVLTRRGSSEAIDAQLRSLAQRVVALDPIIDDAIGESSEIRYHSTLLHRATKGIFDTLTAIREIAGHLAAISPQDRGTSADFIIRVLPHLQTLASRQVRDRLLSAPLRLQQDFQTASRALRETDTRTVSERILADEGSQALTGLAHILDGISLLAMDPRRPRRTAARFQLLVPDWLPASLNAGRAFVAIVATELFWIATAWPNGSAAITWAAVSVILFAPREDEAYSASILFMWGSVSSAIIAAIVLFAVLPQVTTFAGLAVVLGVYYVPAGILMASWPSFFAIALVASFMPMPQSDQSDDL